MTPAPAADLLRDGRSILIGGEWKSAQETFEVTDPSSPGQVTAKLGYGTPEDVAAAFEAAGAAGAAADGWGSATAQARGAILMAAADRLAADADEAAERLTLDMGKARRDSLGEVLRGVAILRYFAGQAIQANGEVYPSADTETTLMTIEEPVGTIAVITPWNFPVAIPLWKIAPALAFGNTVVWKPASAAAGSAVLIARILEEAGLPDGVINLVTGRGGELSDAITGAAGLRALSFTGSGGTGMAIQQAMSGTTAKLQLELGGKNPAIVLADADLADAALQISRGAFLSTGQRCTATSRAYVERAVFDEFLELLRTETDGLTVGDPHQEGTDVGPAASRAQFESVNDYLDLARAEGATFVTGGEAGEREGNDGYFITPTILTGLEPASRLIKEEIFGPVLCLIPVDGYEQALEMANDTEFGLSSAVFTSNLKTAMKFARATQSGLVHVNRETAGVEPHVPFGGLKGSSNNQREQGTAARRFFTNTKTVYIRTP